MLATATATPPFFARHAPAIAAGNRATETVGPPRRAALRSTRRGGVGRLSRWRRSDRADRRDRAPPVRHVLHARGACHVGAAGRRGLHAGVHGGPPALKGERVGRQAPVSSIGWAVHWLPCAPAGAV